MNLSPAEATLFFKLMLSLQYFTNEKRRVLKNVNSFEKYCKLSMQEKFEVRNALFENVGLIDDFIDENPQDIPMKELTVAARWKTFVAGDFFIERHLKAHSIFVSDEDKVYAVRGLTQALDEHFPKFALPARVVSAVLLPFLGKIVTDGFFVPQRIIFGGAIKEELKVIYTQAKRKDKIIMSLG